MKTSSKTLRRRLLLAAGVTLLSSLGHAAVVLNAGSLNYSQNFDSLPNVNGSDPLWTNDSTLAGWHLYAGADLAGPVSNIRVSTSSGTDRAHISYGQAGSTDRALGMQAGSSHRYSSHSSDTGDVFGGIAVAFSNQTGGTLDGFAFNYDGEQWHVSSNANVAHNLVVRYAIGSSTTAFDQLNWQLFAPNQVNAAGVDFYTPTLAGGTTGNGNLAANRTIGLGATVTGLAWNPGDMLWISWTTLNFPASDHGMAIDNFSLTAMPAEVPLPAAAWLMLSGLGALGLGRHRSRRA